MRPIPIIVLLLVNVDAEWVLASGTGQDCDTVCSGLGRTCDEQALVDLQTTELCSDTAVEATFASAMSKASISGQCSSLLRIKSRLGSIADLHLANLACFIDEWPASCTLSAVYNALCCCESTPGTCGQELVANGCTLPSTTTTVTSTTTGTSTMTSVTTTRSTTTTVTTTTVTTTTITTITSTTTSITTTTITTTATISSSTTISTTATKTSSSTLTSSSSTVSVTSTTTSSATISSSTTISTTVTQTTSTSSSVTSSSTSSTTNTVTTTTSSTLTSSSTTVTQTTSTSSSVTQTTSTSSSVTQTTSTSSSVTSSSTSSTTNTVTTTSITSSSTTLTSVTQSSTTTSTTLLLKLQLPPDVEAENPEGTVITAFLQGALAVLEANQESIVLETDTGEVTVVKLNTPTTSDAFVFEFPAAGEDNESSAAAIAVSVPVSLVQQLQLEGNVMLSVTQLNEESMATLGDTSGSTVILLAPIIDFSLVQENAGAVKTATVSGLVDPIIFRIADASPTEEDLCVFFDFDTNSWSTEGVALATSAQVAALSGVNSSGTWCAATHLSLFSSAQITPLENRIEQEHTIDWNSYMIAVILMVVLCIPTCIMFCTWSFFLARPAASGKTKIQGISRADARGRSHVVTFTRNKIMADRMPSEKSPKNAEQKKKVLVTWDVEPDQIMSSIKHMQGHGWVAMDSRVVQTKSMTSMRSMTREKSNISEELRKASQEGVPQAGGLEEDGVSFSDIVEESLVEASLSWMGKAPSYEVFEDREPVYYWSTTHQMLMQAFISGSGMFDDDEPTYNVMVGPHRQLRQQVPCQYLFAALRDGDTVFYDEGDGKTRIWRKGIVVENIHARGTIRLFDVSEQEGTLASDQLPREASAGDLEPSNESTTGAKSGEAAHKTVSISRICRRFEKGQIVCVFQGQETGWQSAVVGHVEDFTDEFSPLHLKSLQVHLASVTDPVDIQTCFIRFAKAGDGIGISV